MKQAVVCMRELNGAGERCIAERRICRKGNTVPLHWHDYYECEILLSGRARHIFNGHAYEACAGEAWLMSPSDFHTVETEEELRLLHVGIAGGFLSPELEDAVRFNGFVCRLSPAEMARAEGLFSSLSEELERGDPLRDVAARATLDLFVSLLLRAVGEGRILAVSPAIAATLEYLHANFTQEISLEGASRMQGFTPNYFGNLFRNAMGISFRDYLNKLRLRYACTLLSTTQMSVKEIALSSGYRSVEYFFYVFRRHLGTTPNQYRLG
jgi:AraC-like DNA-binding protein